MSSLTEPERERYDRQITISGFDRGGQEKLKKAVVLIAGAGGLGCAAATYLVAAGVGKIRIVDHDKVELSNLNRQILHWSDDIGRGKVQSAKEKLERLNPNIQVEAIEEVITEENVSEIVAGCYLIVDALDNFPTRFLLNRVALEKGIPLFHGAIYGFEGRAMTVIPGRTPCLKCLYRGIPPSERSPVIGVTPAVIGCIQATEVIKYIAGIGELLGGRLLIYDGLSLKFMEVEVKQNPACGECIS